MCNTVNTTTHTVANAQDRLNKAIAAKAKLLNKQTYAGLVHSCLVTFDTDGRICLSTACRMNVIKILVSCGYVGDWKPVSKREAEVTFDKDRTREPFDMDMNHAQWADYRESLEREKGKVK